jgi:hypothetical protein
MISLLRERNVLGIVCLGGDRRDAFEAPIFGLVLFDTFAVSSTRKKPHMQVWHQSHLQCARYQDKGVQSALFALLLEHMDLLAQRRLRDAKSFGSSGRFQPICSA